MAQNVVIMVSELLCFEVLCFYLIDLNINQ